MNDFNCSLSQRLVSWVTDFKEECDLINPVPALTYALFPKTPGPSIGILGCFERDKVPNHKTSGFVTIDGIEFFYHESWILDEINGKTIDLEDGIFKIY